MLDAGCGGAILAVVLRWLFRLDAELHWAICIGTVSLLLEPWLSLHFGPHVRSGSFGDLAMGMVVALAFVGIAQVGRQM